MVESHASIQGAKILFFFLLKVGSAAFLNIFLHVFELFYRFLKQSIILTNHTTCMRIDADDLVDSLATVGLTSVVASELERGVNAPI